MKPGFYKISDRQSIFTSFRQGNSCKNAKLLMETFFFPDKSLCISEDDKLQDLSDMKFINAEI